MMNRRRQIEIATVLGLTALFCISRVVVFRYMVGVNSDVGVHHQYGALIARGQVPFRDFSAEYPPLALLFAALPMWIDRSGVHYDQVFRGLCFTADTAVWITLLVVNHRRPAWSLLYLLCTTALGSVLYDRHDLILGFLLLVSLLCHGAGRLRAATALAGVGIAFKLIPVVWAPVLLAGISRRGWRALATAAALLVGPAALTVATLIIAGSRDFGFLVRYHADRATQIESVPASIQMALMAFGWSGAVHGDHGSQNLLTSAGPAIVLGVSVMLAGVVVAAGLWVLSRRRSPAAVRVLLVAMLVATLSLSKVLSPQYLLFVLPVLAATPLTRRPWAAVTLWVVVLEICGLSGLIFPWWYNQLLDLDPSMQWTLGIRNALLVGLAMGLFLCAADTDRCLTLGDAKGALVPVQGCVEPAYRDGDSTWRQGAER